ncbi:polyprenyl synthetase family protein, partial [Facilibium subflavum]|uniref:polyprenyl synthetase family protein n=1 Tax=Facilibium subflavum TaxID=2219058 RepID=UPI0013C34F9A
MKPDWQKKIQSFENFAAQYLNQQTFASSRLQNAMEYSFLDGGKRIRALLCYLSGEIFHTSISNQHLTAFAIEAIHAYSLIHDDLPAMDNDDLRRGKPTCHIQFDEATAILAGDALQSLAFHALSSVENISLTQLKQTITLLADHAGGQGMVSGQQLDMDANGRQLNIEQLQQIHRLKTGKMITASVLLPFYLSDQYQDDAIEHNLQSFADCIGLAFQIKDDILDVTADTKTLGKTAQSDLKHQKATYPAL